LCSFVLLIQLEKEVILTIYHVMDINKIVREHAIHIIDKAKNKARFLSVVFQ